MKEIHRIQISPEQVKKVEALPAVIKIYANKNGEFYASRFSLMNMNKHHIHYKILEMWELKEVPIKLIYPPQTIFYEAPTATAITEALSYALSLRSKKKPMQVFYEGRMFNRTHLPSSQHFYLDQVGGNRSYLWRVSSLQEKVQDLRKMFPKLAALVKDPDTRTVLSFGSGGIRLYAHPTLMKFFDLLELRSFIDEIWGCSGGAIAGLPYAAGVLPRLIEEEGYHLYNDRYSIRFSPHKFEVIKNILFDHFLPNSDHMLKGFTDCQKQLRQVFEKYVSAKDKKQNRIPFFCLAYNIKAQRLEILTPEKINRPHYPVPIFHAQAMEAMIASSSVPILFVPKKIVRGKTEHIYVDGGTVEEVPLLSVFQKWKQDRNEKIETRSKLLIISVNLFPHFSENSLFKHWLMRLLPTSKLLHLFAKYTDMIRDARIAEQMKYLSQHKRVRVIDLHLPMKEGAILDPMVIPQVIKTAQKSFFNQLLEHEKKLSM